MAKNRKAAFKVPPSTVNVSESQDLRRRKALEEQKRRRTQRVDSSRQLDLFADLNLGQSDGEEEGEDPGVVRMGIAAYASMLPSTSTTPDHIESLGLQTPKADGKKKKKRKQKSKKEAPTTSNKWADQCMYAELLEMNEDDPWTASESNADGLPEDLETGWVAMAPVPIGKRCLAVTDQSLGVPGLVPNTSLRSRKLGKLLMPRFPSTLPPLTILDCILDNNWRENGILHILDVLKWKGQDIGDCETSFRFWWRDTRLGELSASPPPSTSNDNQQSNPALPNAHLTAYRFPYPTKFLAVPYHADISLSVLESQIVPLAQTSRFIDIDVPISPTDAEPTQSMVVDQLPANEATVRLTTRSVEVCADGLLLYVAEASYEAGTSPLSSWIPIVKYDEARVSDGMTDPSTAADGPLNLFHRSTLLLRSVCRLTLQSRLVQKRIVRNSTSLVTNSSLHTDMEI
ncbi:hypothetical protein C8R43DRAFT_893270 [Mycena crocata]|nr:hypothetical protein C8R43DRAFT_893270 [Mycena crocata]